MVIVSLVGLCGICEINSIAFLNFRLNAWHSVTAMELVDIEVVG